MRLILSSFDSLGSMMCLCLFRVCKLADPEERVVFQLQHRNPWRGRESVCECSPLFCVLAGFSSHQQSFDLFSLHCVRLAAIRSKVAAQGHLKANCASSPKAVL